MSTSRTLAVARFAQALEAMERGDWRSAQALAEDLLPIAGRAAGPYFVAGVSALQLDQVQRAIARLAHASQLEPQRGDYQAQYARALAMAGNLSQASAVARSTLRLQSVDAASLDTLGIVLSRAALHDEAATAFARAVTLAPSHPGYRYNLATSLMFHGDLAGAEGEYEECLRLDPRCWRADLSISQLRRQTARNNHLDRLRQRLAGHGADPQARLYLNLALAKELEDIGEDNLAFDHYASGKSVLAHRARALIDLAERSVAELIRRHDRQLPTNAGCPNSEPIFIVGMPRSGTTLVDRMISGHQAVHSAGELQNFGMQMRLLAGRSAATLLETAVMLPPDFGDWFRLGSAYIDSTRPATGHTPRFTDKYPLNFLLVADIARALPDARFICLRRDPLDTCLSNFRQLFSTEAGDFDYSFDLLASGRYYLLFDRLMRHWHSVLPGRILDVNYEVLVDAPEATLRRILDFCQLPWRDECLYFERNPAAAATASAAQVRSPLNRTSLQRWKRYRSRLGPLKDLLVAGGIDIGEPDRV